MIPGGFVGSVTRAFGPRAAGVAKAAALVERFLLGALACVLVGHYAASVAASAIAGRSFTGYLRAEDLATLIAIGALGVLWLQTRLGREIGRDALARASWIGIGVVLVTIVWALVTLARHGAVSSSLALPAPVARTGWFRLIRPWRGCSDSP